MWSPAQLYPALWRDRLEAERGGLLLAILPVKRMEVWEFVQRDWAVPMAHSHWHCLREGQVFLWLTGGGQGQMTYTGGLAFGEMLGHE